MAGVLGQHQAVQHFVGCSVAADSHHNVNFRCCCLRKLDGVPRLFCLHEIEIQARCVQPALDLGNRLPRRSTPGCRIDDQPILAHTNTIPCPLKSWNCTANGIEQRHSEYGRREFGPELLAPKVLSRG